MKPVLYESSETEYKTNGIGRLADAISCEVTEERNGDYELEMDYPVTGVHYKDIKYGRIIYAVPADGKKEQPFEIYEISKPFDGIVTVRAEHISYRLKYIPVTAFTASTASEALSGLTSNSVTDNPFTFETDKTDEGTFEVDEPTAIRELLGADEGKILDVFGGEWEFDGFTAHLWENRGHDSGITIRYGKNLTDLTQEENIEETVTGIMPYWKGASASDSDTQVTVTIPDKVLYISDTSIFPYARVVPVDLTSRFDGEPSADQVKEEAQKYIEENEIGVPKVSIKMSFIPIWQTEEYKDIANIERVNLCDTIQVYFERLGVSTSAKVTKTVYDALAERYTSIELGEAKDTLNDAMKKYIDPEKIQGAVEAANQELKRRQAELKKQQEAAEKALQEQIDEVKGTQKFGRKTLSMGGSSDAELFTMSDLDSMFGLPSGTCSSENTMVNAASADTSTTVGVTSTYVSGDSWRVSFASAISGSITVAYMAKFTG